MPGSSVPPETAEGGPAAENASTVDHLGIGFADSWDGGAGLRAARHEVAFQSASGVGRNYNFRALYPASTPSSSTEGGRPDHLCRAPSSALLAVGAESFQGTG